MKEAARYLGLKRVDERTAKLIEEAERESESLTPSYVSACYTLVRLRDGIGLVGTDIVLRGRLAERHFADSEKIIAVLATLGLKSEILMKKSFAVSATKGVVLDAVYTAKIESFLDEIEEKLKKEYKNLTNRISCGYGDLSIETQKKLFDNLHGERIGVGINDCCMLTPNKSVIALLGAK